MNDKALSLFFLLILIGTLILSCQTIEESILYSFTPIAIDKINTTKIILSGKTKYYNSNPLGAKLDEIYLNVFANDVSVSTVTQDLDIDIKANSNFGVPIEINIPVKSILDKRNVLPGGLVNAITQRKIKLKHSGIATVNFAKLELSLPIEKEEEVNISL